MGYSGKTADNKTSQLDSVSWTPVKPTLAPTNPGPRGTGVKGDNLPTRTSSPNAENEKLYEPVSGGPSQVK